MSSLYPALLGKEWASLAPPVQRLHGGGVRARGLFTIRRGASWLARLIATVLGMPRAGEGVAITLAVEATAAGETWSRVFGDRGFSTAQWRRGAALVEAVGLVQCLFRLRVAEGALVMDQVGARFGARRFSLPLPRWLAPTIEGRVSPRGDQVHVDVRVRAPIVGFLVSYDGLVTPAAPEQAAA